MNVERDRALPKAANKQNSMRLSVCASLPSRSRWQFVGPAGQECVIYRRAGKWRLLLQGSGSTRCRAFEYRIVRAASDTSNWLPVIDRGVVRLDECGFGECGLAADLNLQSGRPFHLILDPRNS